jgi:hypothetical protein
MKSLALFAVAAAALVAFASPASAAFLTLQTGPTFTPAGDFSNNTIKVDTTVGGAFLHVVGGATVTPAAISSVNDMDTIAIGGTYSADAGDVFSVAYSFTVDLNSANAVSYTLTGTVTVAGTPVPVSATGKLMPGLHQYQGTAVSPRFPGPASGNFSGTLAFGFGSATQAPLAPAQGAFDLNIQQVDFQVGPQAATLETASQPQNLSTRVNVGTDQDVLIGGFIITGTAHKQVILRAIGPSLAQDKIANPLADPILELHDSTGAIVATNDNWKGNSTADQMILMANMLAPKNNAESALVRRLAPGAYTAIVRGVGGDTGVALVEVYDIDNGATNSKLANISTRGNVGTGEDVMIGGFIVGGGGGGFTTTIVRGLGPSLSGSGITNPLADPTLMLNDANGNMIDSNDNWMDNPNAQTITSDHLAPKNAAESVLYEILPAGSYTAILSGANASSGVGLVEIYDVQ